MVLERTTTGRSLEINTPEVKKVLETFRTAAHVVTKEMEARWLFADQEVEHLEDGDVTAIDRLALARRIIGGVSSELCDIDPRAQALEAAAEILDGIIEPRARALDIISHIKDNGRVTPNELVKVFAAIGERVLPDDVLSLLNKGLLLLTTADGFSYLSLSEPTKLKGRDAAAREERAAEDVE